MPLIFILGDASSPLDSHATFCLRKAMPRMYHIRPAPMLCSNTLRAELREVRLRPPTPLKRCVHIASVRLDLDFSVSEIKSVLDHRIKIWLEQLVGCWSLCSSQKKRIRLLSHAHTPAYCYFSLSLSLTLFFPPMTLAVFGPMGKQGDGGI